MKKNIFNLFFNKIFEVPFPLKQLLYIKFTKEMGNLYGKNMLPIENSFVSYVPILTFKGETELLEKKCGLDNNIYRFLQCCTEGMGILEISINTFLSMEETAKYYEFCLDQDFIEKPDNQLLAIAKFISGKIRLGEYLQETGIITEEQLNKVLNLCSNSKRIGEVLTELKLIKENDLKTVLMLKEESKKRIILDYNTIPTAKTAFSDEKQQLEQEISSLKDENTKLKRKMQQILKLVKQNEQL